MKRRAFLRYGAGAMAVASLPPLRSRAAASDTVEYRLTSGPLSFEPVPGVRVAGLAYNGAIPGPLLRVIAGQRVRVRYVSGSDVPTSVHWHGMVLPNAMDGVAGITQPAVERGGEFVYEFAPGPSGTRWYHDHAFHGAAMRGLFGMFVVVDPREDPADREFALTFHDVPLWSSVEAALRGRSTATMQIVPGSPEAMQAMHGMRMPGMPDMQAMHGSGTMAMGDEVAYVAHCIDGATYPRTRKMAVRVGDRVRLRILNASPTQTRYIRLAEHRLLVTHADGNRLERPVEVDALRVGVGERYDATFEVRRAGAFLLQGLSAAPGAPMQAAVIHTEGMEDAPPASSPASLVGVEYFTYERAGGRAGAPTPTDPRAQRYDFALGGGRMGSAAWTIDGAVWPNTPKIVVRSGDEVVVRFTNPTDMEHPMHLHGHAFELLETGGVWFERPLRKDVSLVPANGGTTTWRFAADASPGRWLLHCHNDIHMMDGMMTEVVYRP